MTASQEEALARSAVYELLSLAFLYPEGGATVRLAERARALMPVAAELGWKEREQTLASLADQLRSLDDEALLSEHTQVFGHSVAADCPPYEGEYGQAHIFQKSQTLADLNTFYQAFGVTLSPELKDRPDHVSVELEFMHLLALKEAWAKMHNHGEEKVQLCRKAQEMFLARHLADWVTTFARRVAEKAGSGSLHAALAQLLDRHMAAEFAAFRIDATAQATVAVPGAPEDDRECDTCPLVVDIAKGGKTP